MLMILADFLSRNEKASAIYTTDLMTKILMEEGKGLFDARSASLGHTLQGGIPSPMDRARAVRLASKCMAFLEEHARGRTSSTPPKHGRHGSASVTQPHQTPRRASKETAAMITIQGTAIKFTSVQDVVQYADMQNRRALHSWWEPYKELAEQLGGLPQFL